jgi:hypothetical protein
LIAAVAVVVARPLSAEPASRAAPGGAAGLRPPVQAVDDEERPRTRPERQWGHIAAASGEDCRERLKQTGAKFRALPDITKPDKRGCGVPRGVIVTKGPTGITYSPPLHIDCSLALRLPEIERVVQEEANASLTAPVVRAATLGSFACRGVIGRLRGWTGGISEHSFGNAFDVSRFDAKNGKRAAVLKSMRPGEEPTTPEGIFLARVAWRLRRELGVRVLGPNFDPSHRDHLHIDAGSPWWQ